MSATLAAVARAVWTTPRLSAPMCSFIPKCQLRPLRVCFISGSRVAVAFLVELGAAMVAEVQNRTLVRHHLVAQLNPRETPHRLAVVDRIFGLWVRQIEPLLQEVSPQFLLQSQRLATLAGFGVV